MRKLCRSRARGQEGTCSGPLWWRPRAARSVGQPAVESGRSLGLGQQTGRCDAGDKGMNGAMQELPQIAPLAQAGLMGREAAGDEAVAPQGATGTGDLALEHDAAKRLLGRIVRCALPRRG